MSKNERFEGRLHGAKPWRARLDDALESWGAWVCRHRWGVIGAASALTIALASQLPHMTADFSTEGYLHPDDPALALYDEFRDQFEQDDAIVVALAPADVFELRFLETLRALHRELDAHLPYVDDITSLVNARFTRGERDTLIVGDLMEDWPETQADLEVLRRRVLANPLYPGALISKDASLTTLTIRPQVYSSHGSEAALDGFEETAADSVFLTEPELTELVDAVQEITARYAAPDLEIHVVGAPVISAYMNRTSQADTSLFTGLAIGLMGLLLYVLFRRVSAVVLPLLVVTTSILASFGIMALLHIPFSTMTQILPSLLLAVGICDAVHIIAIVYQEMAAGSPRHDAIAAALGHSGTAVIMTSATTAGGLLSFVGADLLPISNLGVVAPIGISMVLLYTLTLLPALLAVWPLGAPREGRTARALRDGLTRLGDFAVANPIHVLVGTAMLLTVTCLGMTRLRFGLDTLAWIPKDDPVRVAVELIDDKLEGSGRIELLIDAGRENVQSPRSSYCSRMVGGTTSCASPRRNSTVRG